MLNRFPLITGQPVKLNPPSRRSTMYIIFHRDVLSENTREYTKDELNERFVWVAVNETLPKLVPRNMEGVHFLEEYKLANYRPFLQAKRYYQNSFFFHLYWNPHLLTSEYVGFAQYDMEFHKDEYEKCLDSINGTSNIVVGFYPYDFKQCPHVYDWPTWDKMFLQPYNQYHGTKHTWETIGKHPLCLYHTFILPREFFVHMMQFAEKNMNNLLFHMRDDTRHMAGTLERIFAFTISCALEEGRLQFKLGTGIEHHDEQRWSDPFRGMPGRIYNEGQ